MGALIWRGLISVGLALCLTILGGGRAPAEARDAATVRAELTTLAESFRDLGVANPTQLSSLTKDELGDPAFRLNLPATAGVAERQFLWSQFFRASSIHLARLGAKFPLIGYFNPVLDAWLITEWGHDGADYYLTKAYVRLGDRIQAPAVDPRPAMPAWVLAGRGAMSNALSALASDRIAAFGATFADAEKRLSVQHDVVPQLEVFAYRAARIAAGLVGLRQASTYNENVKRIVQGLAAESGAALSAEDHAKLEPIELNKDQWRSLQPVAAIAFDEGVFVLIGAGNAGVGMIELTFAMADGHSTLVSASTLATGGK